MSDIFIDSYCDHFQQHIGADYEVGSDHIHKICLRQRQFGCLKMWSMRSTTLKQRTSEYRYYIVIYFPTHPFKLTVYSKKVTTQKRESAKCCACHAKRRWESTKCRHYYAMLWNDFYTLKILMILPIWPLQMYEVSKLSPNLVIVILKSITLTQQPMAHASGEV